MNVLLLGAGGVGEAFATITARRNHEYLDKMIIADYNKAKSDECCDRLNETYKTDKFVAEQINALDGSNIVNMAKKYDIGIIVTCLDTDPFDLIVMDACLEANCHYIDMGLTQTERDPEDPTIITKLPGEDQFKKSKAFEEKGLFAVCACGVEPGMIDFFAKYAEKHYFDEIEGMYIRDGGDIHHPTNPVAFNFSIFQTAIECNLGPILWTKEKGLHSAPPLTLKETFWFPGGIGNVEVSGIEHSEPMNISRHIGKGIKESNFKITFGKELEDAMLALNKLGMINTEKIKVGDVDVCPLDVLEATAPNPKYIGRELVGKTCAGLWVKGKKDGLERSIYIYQYTDNQEAMAMFDCQAVSVQTATTPAIVAELLATGKMDGPFGANVPEAFNPDPVLSRLLEYGCKAGVLEMESEYRDAQEFARFRAPFAE